MSSRRRRGPSRYAGCRAAGRSPRRTRERLAFRPARQVDLDRPLGEDVQAVALVAGGEQRRARGPLDPLERGRERLLPLDRQHVEERHGRDRGELLLRHVAPASIDTSAPRITSESTGKIAPATASVQRAPARWRRSGVSTDADAEAADGRRLDEAEDAARDSGGGRPLDQRHRGDVDDAVADPEQAERDDRRPRLRQRCERDQRSAEAGEAEAEVGRGAPAADERERDDRADDRADAGRRLQEPDAGVAEVEQLERDDDDKHAVGTRDDASARCKARSRCADEARSGRRGSRRRSRPPLHAHATARLRPLDLRDARDEQRAPEVGDRDGTRTRGSARRRRRAARRPQGLRTRRCCRTCSR